MRRREPTPKVKHQDYWSQVGKNVEDIRQRTALETARLRDMRPLEKRKSKKSRRIHGPT